MSKAHAIQCKSCHASLVFEVESRQLESLTCEYCGQVHDVQKNFRTLHHFKNSLREIRRIALGTEGKINGIAFMVIGYVVYTEVFTKDLSDLDEDEYWIEYQLYSKTHGYAFLSCEENEYFFYRKVRDLPTPLLTETHEEDEVYYRGLTFTLDEPYDAYVYAVAGSLTWTAKIGNKSNCIDAEHSSGFFSSTEYFLAYEKSSTEEEYYLGEPIYDLDYEFKSAVSSVKQQKEEPIQNVTTIKRESTRKKRHKKKVIKSIRRKNRANKAYRERTVKRGKRKSLFSLFQVSLLSFFISIIALAVLLIVQHDGKPLLRYFFFFMIIAIFGMLADEGRKKIKYTLDTAYKLLFWFTLLLYLSALVPPFFLFLGFGLLIFMGLAYGTIGFFIMLGIYIYSINVLTS